MANNGRNWGGAAVLLALACNAGDGGFGFSDEGVGPGAESSTSGASSSSPSNTASSGGSVDTSGGPGIGTECAEVTAMIEPVIPTIVLVIDQSGSMNDPLGAVSRWQAVDDAMFDPGSGIVTQLQAEVRFGMALYTSNNGSFGGPCPMLVEVQPMLDNRDAMVADFSMPVIEGDTPTGDAVAAVAAVLAQSPDEAKAIVLATDGDPDTCMVPDPQTGQPESIAAVQEAFDLGIDTFVVSVGGEIGQAHLQELANAGVGKALDDPAPAPFYEALDPAGLVDAFDQIIGSFASCEFAIEGEVDLDRVCEGTVRLDGEILDCGMQWDVPEPSTLVLLGDACATVQDGGEHSVEASFPCEVINVP